MGLINVQLPGRGSRIFDPCYNQMSKLTEDLVTILKQDLDRPYAMLGYSLGGMLAYEIAVELSRSGQAPVWLGIGAIRAPKYFTEKRDRHLWDEPKLIEELRRLGGTPEEIFQNPELLELVLPTVRADFEILDSYQYEERPKLDCPISVFAGKEDPESTPEWLGGWADHTSKKLETRLYPGGHFFLKDEPTAVIADIISDLKSIQGAPKKASGEKW